jgi:hypothetical protein
MVRLIAVLLLGILAAFVFVRALRHGEAQVSFTYGNVRRRKNNPMAFWFFTFMWGVVAVGGIAGVAVLLYHGINSSGPFATRTFFTFQRKEWPLGVMIVACLYLIAAHVQALKPSRPDDGA